MSRYIVDSKKDLLSYEQLIWTPLRCLEDADKAIDDAYQRGVEDGKKSKEKGCEGCKYEECGDTEDPCWHCRKNYKDKYEPAPHSDRIEVGDEVQAPRGKAIVTAVKDDLVHYFYSEGDFGCVEPYRVTKTGKHYDIQSILEAMRE